MNTFKKLVLKTLFFAFAISPFYSTAINHVSLSMQNATSTSNTVEFDVFIVNDGTTALKLRGYQFGINFNSAILNGGVPLLGSYISLPGSRDAVFATLASNNAGYSNFQLKNVVTNSTVPNAVNLPLGTPLKLGRFQFTNVVPWLAGSAPNFQFQLLSAGGKLQCLAAVYSDSTTLFSNLLNPISVSNPVSTLNAVSNISGFIFSFPLPVSISNFTGSQLVSKDVLQWTTSHEENNSYFNLQHSNDGINFITIDKVYSIAERGNSSCNLNYTSQFAHPNIGSNYYRLQQVDINGHATMETIIVELVRIVNERDVNIFPNPATDILNINFNCFTEQRMIIKILDLTGRVIKTTQLISSEGLNKIIINLNDVIEGEYLIQLYENNKVMYTKKISKRH